MYRSATLGKTLAGVLILGMGVAESASPVQTEKGEGPGPKAAPAVSSARPEPAIAVAWRGAAGAREAAVELAAHAGKVLGVPTAVESWPPSLPGRVRWLVTEARYAPRSIAARLEGTRRDAFVIQYPVQQDGHTVCLLASHDEFACDYPVYEFLRRFMDVHWVGPGELGVIWSEKRAWRMPEQIDILENPDFEMRLWTGQSFTSRPWLARSSRMGFHHALGHVFHPAKHGDSPEVYPLIAGKRYIPEVREGAHALSGWQPCTSSPRSVDIAVEHVVDALKKNPRMLSASLSVNDGAGNTCECPLCRALDPKDVVATGARPSLSDRFFHFYNRVTERVLQKWPEAYVAVLGYGPCKSPPTRDRVNPRILVFEVQPSVAALKAWGAAGARPNLYLWLWDGGFLTVRPDLGTLAELVRTAKSLGGIGCYSEIQPQWTVSAPKFYVLASLLWDSRRDPSALLNEYLRLAYGSAAAPALRDYFDRWYAIYRRRPAEERYRTSWGWRSAEQLAHLQRGDLAALDASIEAAAKATMTPPQRQRLAYFTTYHRLMRINAEQYLTGREMADSAWVLARRPEEVLALAERSTALPGEFDRIWSEEVVVDRSGWLLDARYQKSPQGHWDQAFAQLRATVNSGHETGVDQAVETLSRQLLARQSREQVIAYWETQGKRHPGLQKHIGPQVLLLRGVVPPDVVVNGGFERGSPGDPPTLEGWHFYESYGMVKGVKARYAWEPGSGHDGGRAVGLGQGRFPEMKSLVQLDKGHRYELSLWYKTVGRDTPPNLQLFSYDGPLSTPSQIDQTKIARFFQLDLEPTDGAWKKVVRTITPTRTGTFIIQLAAYYQKPDWWVWFDEFQIRKIW